MRKHSSPSTRFLPHGLVILHEDRDILVVDKPAGLLTMGTDSDKTRTAYFILTETVPGLTVGKDDVGTGATSDTARDLEDKFLYKHSGHSSVGHLI